MGASLPQSVLDALTDVDMPKRHPGRAAREQLTVAGFRVPLYACEALVLGSGQKLEHHPVFPQRANIEFVRVNRPDDVTARVWEREITSRQSRSTPDWSGAEPIFRMILSAHCIAAATIASARGQKITSGLSVNIESQC